MKNLLLLFLIFNSGIAFGQGYNHQWLLGSANFLISPKGRMYIDSTNNNIITEFRKMPFKGTQGNISDGNGNLLIVSNGNWVANATGDTMMNGSGINPGPYASMWPFGLPFTSGNLILPFPNDSLKYILFHQTTTDLGNVPSNELFYSLIDISLDSGLGAVISKNNIIYSDSLSYGITACKNSNGQDWWIITVRDSSDVVLISELTNAGIVNSSTQSLGFLPFAGGNVSQLTFSPNGDKFINNIYDNPVDRNSSLVISDFNRCNGTFSNTQTLHLESGGYLWGLSFSPSGKYIYACSSNNIFQIDTDTYIVDTVATYDGYISPGPTCCATSFWNMYSGANGKIYVTSGSGVQHLHVINYPDSAGAGCDVQQHSIDLVDYLHLRAVPNHPNYYLGCDTTLGCPCLTTTINELSHNFKFSISPNPTNGNFKIIYMLPQKKSGRLEVIDVNGRRIYEMNLPTWSTLQEITLPSSIAGGVYNCVISSNRFSAYSKLVVMKN